MDVLKKDVFGVRVLMATPTRRDMMYKHLMAQHRKKHKEGEKEEEKPKDEESINNLIKLWENKKKKL